jgi:hypothetical protein
MRADRVAEVVLEVSISHILPVEVFSMFKDLEITGS